MSSDPKDVVRSVYSSVNRGDLAAMSDRMADDIVEHEELPGFEGNKEGVLQFFGVLTKAFPDLSMTADDMIGEGDKVFVRGRMSGTHQGEFMGMPPTGNRFEVLMADFFRVRDGLIAEHWGVSDMSSMMAQLGGAHES